MTYLFLGTHSEHEHFWTLFSDLFDDLFWWLIWWIILFHVKHIDTFWIQTFIWWLILFKHVSGDKNSFDDLFWWLICFGWRILNTNISEHYLITYFMTYFVRTRFWHIYFFDDLFRSNTSLVTHSVDKNSFDDLFCNLNQKKKQQKNFIMTKISHNVNYDLFWWLIWWFI